MTADTQPCCFSILSQAKIALHFPCLCMLNPQPGSAQSQKCSPLAQPSGTKHLHKEHWPDGIHKASLHPVTLCQSSCLFVLQTWLGLRTLALTTRILHGGLHPLNKT